jgi:hypothetical protein
MSGGYYSVIGGLLCAILISGTSLAFEKKGIVAHPPAAKKTMQALTEGECKGLGGQVDFNVHCKTGSGCYRVDQDGVLKMICITSKK